MWLWNINLVLLVVLLKHKTYGTTKKPFVDVFLPGLPGGRPTLGSARSTCWARGGICIDIRYCTTMQFDPSVAGCTQGYKVCCKSNKFGSPTVGARKSSNILVFTSTLQELDRDSIRGLAVMNTYTLKRLI